ncbi:MAG: hypothetical protein R2867_36655 [Caldilineaceae bacterium]
MFAQSEHGLRLYSRKILIQQRNKDLLPDYFRFVEGVVDSEDLPLNVCARWCRATRCCASCSGRSPIASSATSKIWLRMMPRNIAPSGKNLVLS